MRIAILLSCLFLPLSSEAIVKLRDYKVPGDNRIEIHFDSTLRSGQVQTDFFNDIIQISLNEVSVYPAKLSEVQGGEFRKIFAYQYTPQAARFRISVSGNAESFRNRLHLKTEGNKLILTAPAMVDPLVDKIESKASAPQIEAKEENEILQKILKDEAPSTKTVESSKPNTKKYMMKLFGVTAGLVAFLLFIGFIFRRAKRVPLGGKGILNSLRKLIPISGVSEKVIEIVANHSLGPKKNILVVNVKGRTLVLGVSQDNINLITHFQGDGDWDGIADLDNGFPELLKQEARSTRPKEIAANQRAAAQIQPTTSIRSEIKKKLQGHKTL